MNIGLLVRPNVYFQAKWSRTHLSDLVGFLVGLADSRSLVI
jgi:hypothetical protein